MLLALALLGLQAGAIPQGGVVRAPDDRLTYGASIAITQCLFMREGQATRAGFVAGVAPLRQRLAADPRLKGVTVDDAGGTGCRVSFIGSKAEADLMAARAAAQPLNQIAFSRRPAPGGLERVSTTLTYPTR
jgi:hypothetical protein